ncbi:MAG: hypothetical protein IT204_21405 [Fimbriimonadaceae bacterium]|nr:hypothetical protein [Fimbriimonadaceae bacterium]
MTTASEHLDLAPRETIHVALHRLLREGKLRRVGRGIYGLPQPDPLLGELLPSPEVVVRASARRDRTRYQPTGAYAANLLGLSDQVPAKVVYLTDGPSRRIQMGPTTIELRHTTARQMAAAGRSGLVIQAFRHLGRDGIAPHHLARLRVLLSAAERRALLADLALAPTWMHCYLRELAEE